MTSYIALIRKDPDSDYGVDFPDFPGCITAGLDMDEARAFAAEALALHVSGMQEDGEVIPEPSNLQTIMDDPHNRDSVAILVDVNVEPVRAIRVNITLPEDVLRQIDAVADNRSAFLAAAALDRLHGSATAARRKKPVRVARGSRATP